MSQGALEGLLIADFSRVLAGPYAAMLLADLGAEVIKVEKPGTGDDTRGWGPPWAGTDSAYFLSANRNKRSIELDLSDETDRRSALALATRADVLIENLRPGSLDSFGLGYEAVQRLNGDIVYCSISGFGLDGGAHLPGYDLLAQSAGGLMSITGPEPGVPTKVGVALADVITGLHAAIGILSAVRHRDKTGEGQRVNVNLLSSVLSALTNQASNYVSAGVTPGIMGNRHPSIAPYETFPTADRPISLAVGNDQQFRTMCAVLGRKDLQDDPRFNTNASRVAHRDELTEQLTLTFMTASADTWFERLSGAGVPCGPINNIAEAFELADHLGLNPLVTMESDSDQPVRQVANPITLTATPPSYRRVPPKLGQDTESVLEWLNGSTELPPSGGGETLHSHRPETSRSH